MFSRGIERVQWREMDQTPKTSHFSNWQKKENHTNELVQLEEQTTNAVLSFGQLDIKMEGGRRFNHNISKNVYLQSKSVKCYNSFKKLHDIYQHSSKQQLFYVKFKRLLCSMNIVECKDLL